MLIDEDSAKFANVMHRDHECSFIYLYSCIGWDEYMFMEEIRVIFSDNSYQDSLHLKIMQNTPEDASIP